MQIKMLICWSGEPMGAKPDSFPTLSLSFNSLKETLNKSPYIFKKQKGSYL